MASLDVQSLFANTPLEEAIDNIVNDLFLTTDKVHNFQKEQLKQLLTFAAYESFFIFDGEYYTQMMVLLWDPPWVQHLVMFFCVIS